MTAVPLPTTTTEPPVPVTSTATVKVARVGVYDAPDQPEPSRHLDNPQPSGALPGTTYPLSMLVVDETPTWVKVLLPVRPNGSSGWVRSADVDLTTTPYRIQVDLSQHKITVWNGNDLFLEEPVAVGASGRTPTTAGLFYTTQLIPTVPEDRAAYGPYAFALSGFSEVYYSFGSGGTGVLGIHGTSDTSSLGKDVSNGCIRMSNDGVTKLAKALPFAGVPVEIKA